MNLFSRVVASIAMVSAAMLAWAVIQKSQSRWSFHSLPVGQATRSQGIWRLIAAVALRATNGSNAAIPDILIDMASVSDRPRAAVQPSLPIAKLHDLKPRRVKWIEEK
jgi:hypothetical protein